MLVSIITVAFNSASTIRDTCRSISFQSYSKFEHIIVDGASSDETVRLASSIPDVRRRIFSDRDDGIYDAMNKGLSLATGDIVGFLNSDDSYMHSGVLMQIVQSIKETTSEACYADVVYVDSTNTIRRLWKSGQFERRSIPLGWVPAHPSFYARRSVYQRFGGFDTSLRLAADHECMTRLLYRHKISSTYVPNVWVSMKLGGATNGSLFGIAQQNYEIALGMHRNNIPLSPLFPFWKIRNRLSQRTSAWHNTRNHPS